MTLALLYIFLLLVKVVHAFDDPNRLPTSGVGTQPSVQNLISLLRDVSTDCPSLESTMLLPLCQNGTIWDNGCRLPKINCSSTQRSESCTLPSIELEMVENIGYGKVGEKVMQILDKQLVSATILDGGDASFFSIDSSGQIYNQRAFNYEQRSVYKFQVRGQYYESNQLTTYFQNVVVSIVDANEPPVCVNLSIEYDEKNNRLTASSLGLDEDSDSVSYQYRWTQNAVDMNQETSFIHLNPVDTGIITYTVYVTPSDGIQDGEPCVETFILNQRTSFCGMKTVWNGTRCVCQWQQDPVPNPESYCGEGTEFNTQSNRCVGSLCTEEDCAAFSPIECIGRWISTTTPTSRVTGQTCKYLRWTPSTPDVFTVSQRYTVEREAQNGGQECPFTHQETRNDHIVDAPANVCSSICTWNYVIKEYPNGITTLRCDLSRVESSPTSMSYIYPMNGEWLLYGTRSEKIGISSRCYTNSNGDSVETITRRALTFDTNIAATVGGCETQPPSPDILGTTCVLTRPCSEDSGSAS